MLNKPCRLYCTVIDIDTYVDVLPVARIVRVYGNFVGAMALYSPANVKISKATLNIPLFDSALDYVGTPISFGEDRILTVNITGPARRLYVGESLYCRRADFHAYRVRLRNTARKPKNHLKD